MTRDEELQTIVAAILLTAPANSPAYELIYCGADVERLRKVLAVARAIQEEAQVQRIMPVIPDQPLF
jgi:hypothetical protein